jgi:hypothetical protein
MRSPSKGKRRRFAAALVGATVWVAGCSPATLAAVTTSEGSSHTSAAASSGTDTLESVAAKASDTGRAVAMSLIGLGLAVAAAMLVFKRDFKEAVGVLAVGVVAVLLATPSGLELLRQTVASLFGSS